MVYWKPEWSGYKENFHKMENGKGFKFVNTWSYMIPTTIQVFFLKWIFYIKIKPKLISGDPKYPQKYVKFEQTHLSAMGLPEGNWND